MEDVILDEQQSLRTEATIFDAQPPQIAPSLRLKTTPFEVKASPPIP